jgi:crotonobetainyl-CoA:carnitine CoA-transferase CaiB-like acyl-CoA transferase
VIGRPDIAGDPRFAEREARKANRAALSAEIEAALARDTAAAWEARLNAAGIPAGRVLTIPEVLDDPQVAARGLLHRFETVPGTDRPLTVLRGGFLVDGAAPAPALPPPRLGAHQAEVLGP